MASTSNLAALSVHTEQLITPSHMSLVSGGAIGLYPDRSVGELERSPNGAEGYTCDM